MAVRHCRLRTLDVSELDVASTRAIASAYNGLVKRCAVIEGAATPFARSRRSTCFLIAYWTGTFGDSRTSRAPLEAEPSITQLASEAAPHCSRVPHETRERDMMACENAPGISSVPLVKEMMVVPVAGRDG